MKYNFLILSLLFCLPGAVILLFRRDLFRHFLLVLPFAIPFAFTEFLFYPEYWEPVFLFDLAARIGFGIEDIIFVSGLAAFTVLSYPVFAGKTFSADSTFSLIQLTKRGGIPVIIAVLAAVIVYYLSVPAIYSSFLIMLIFYLIIALIRRDLVVPGLLGGLFAVVIYFLLCLLLGLLIPGIFNLAWHTDKFINIFILGVPIEELMYGFASGLSATVFYPYITDMRFVSKNENTAA